MEEAEDAVGAELQEDAGEDDGACGGGFGVGESGNRVWTGEEGDFHRKAGEKAQE